jgi:hypothetical protein
MTRFPAAAAALLLLLTLSACGDDDPAAAEAAGAGTSTHEGGASSGHDMGAMTENGDGLRATVDGYTLAAVKAPRKPDQAGTLSFRINGPDGVQKDYARQQDELMHVYLVRQDLTGYQHLHPRLDSASGVWRADLTVPEPGPYRLVTEFEALTSEGDLEDRILGTDFTVAGRYAPVTATPGIGVGQAAVDGFALALAGTPKVHGDELSLTITRDGADVSTLQPYLASFAHITGFREGDLHTVHVHPDEEPDPDDPAATGGPRLTLAPMFTEPGRYRLFIQFKTDDVVHLVPMDIDVAA